MGLSAGRCGLKRVVAFESCGLLGKDLGHKEGLGDCIRVDATTWLCGWPSLRQAGMLCQPVCRLAPLIQTRV